VLQYWEKGYPAVDRHCWESVGKCEVVPTLDFPQDLLKPASLPLSIRSDKIETINSTKGGSSTSFKEIFGKETIILPRRRQASIPALVVEMVAATSVFAVPGKLGSFDNFSA